MTLIIDARRTSGNAKRSFGISVTMFELDETTHCRRPIPDDESDYDSDQDSVPLVRRTKPRKTVRFSDTLAVDIQTGRVINKTSLSFFWRRPFKSEDKRDADVVKEWDSIDAFKARTTKQRRDSKSLIKLGFNKLHRTFQNTAASSKIAIMAWWTNVRRYFCYLPYKLIQEQFGVQ